MIQLDVLDGYFTVLIMLNYLIRPFFSFLFSFLLPFALRPCLSAPLA